MKKMIVTLLISTFLTSNSFACMGANVPIQVPGSSFKDIKFSMSTQGLVVKHPSGKNISLMAKRIVSKDQPGGEQPVWCIVPPSGTGCLSMKPGTLMPVSTEGGLKAVLEFSKTGGGNLIVHHVSGVLSDKEATDLYKNNPNGLRKYINENGPHFTVFRQDTAKNEVVCAHRLPIPPNSKIAPVCAKRAIGARSLLPSNSEDSVDLTNASNDGTEYGCGGAVKHEAGSTTIN